MHLRRKRLDRDRHAQLTFGGQQDNRVYAIWRFTPVQHNEAALDDRRGPTISRQSHVVHKERRFLSRNVAVGADTHSPRSLAGW